MFTFSCRKKVDTISEDNIIRAALNGKIDSIDPGVAYDSVSGTIISQVYETLFEYHYLKRPLAMRPLLSDGFPVYSEDKKTITFTIKENVPYHYDPSFKGQKRFVEAKDFITALKRVAFKGTQSKGWWLFRDKIIGLDEFRDKAKTDINKLVTLDIEGLKALSKTQFQIKLKRYDPQFLFAFTMPFTSPIPLESVIYYNNMFEQIEVGTGPFKLTSLNKNSGAKLQRFPNYNVSKYPSEGDRYSHDFELLKDAGKILPLSDGIQFFVLNEAQPRWLNFLKKNLDFILLVKDNFSMVIDQDGTISQKLEKEGVQLVVSPTLTYWWISFNMENGLVGKNLFLRKAIAHAIDVDKYIDLFTKNVGLKAYSIYPPGIPGHDPNHQRPYEYDLEKAKNYLEKAGYPGGRGLPSIDINMRGNNTTWRQKGEFFKSQLEKIGIHTNVVLNPYPTFLDKESKGKLVLWPGGWALDYPDAENILQLLHSANVTPGPNAANYNNPKIDSLIDKLKLMENGDDKYKIMKEIEHIVEEELPWILLYYDRKYYINHSYLQNYRHSDIIQNFYKYLKIVGK
ncbi:MAG: hypothetical protein H6622_02430 [Halobacteriovoraceae bacterium]|nr:hypothetical protein [Halobacteriovoraceae bacterium]